MKKRVGIVGFGIVGKSALQFLSKYESNSSISVWDERDLSKQEHALIKKYDGIFFSGEKESISSFLEQQDVNIVSPGMNFRLCSQFPCISELDLFAKHFRKRTIAITGTLGKTTVTQMIGCHLFRNAMGGNIGRPMLGLIGIQKDIDWAVLEVSSFQAEQSKNFAPDIAMWTNFYPNHLDHHATLEEYFDAKWRLFSFQSTDQYGIFSRQLLDVDLFVQRIKTYRGKAVFVPIGKNGFDDNVLLSKALFDLLGIKKSESKALHNYEHRCEHFMTINGVDFYNDSKATVVQATKAAVERLRDRPIILVVGGQNKGVDRSNFLKNLYKESSVKKVFCLGDGGTDLIGCKRYASLSDLVHAIMQVASYGDQVLFSPSGASFDLFKDYKERGELFKKTVLELYGDR
jgi:UDP-N-acetylmuramoylalanine--D-glutamate ligase